MKRRIDAQSPPLFCHAANCSLVCIACDYIFTFNYQRMHWLDFRQAI